jgi:hypothetical protein
LAGLVELLIISPPSDRRICVTGRQKIGLFISSGKRSGVELKRFDHHSVAHEQRCRADCASTAPPHNPLLQSGASRGSAMTTSGVDYWGAVWHRDREGVGALRREARSLLGRRGGAHTKWKNPQVWEGGACETCFAIVNGAHFPLATSSLWLSVLESSTILDNLGSTSDPNDHRK